MHEPAPPDPHTTFEPYGITRPAPVLMTYYCLVSLVAGPMFFVALLPLWFKYLTLRYKFDDKGVSMSWGILFRREVLLTYRRIQDIHLTRNIVQRWLGLATVAVQTASGSAGAEMSIEGILEAEPLRDFLYAQMRGAKGMADPAAAAPGPGPSAPDGGDEALTLLGEIRDALVRLADRAEAGP
jgi:putative membrane protein